MDRDERARLRALYEGIAMPWSAVEHHEDGECFGRVSILCDGGDFPPDEVALIDMGHDTECDEAHAALIVGAVNAMEPLLDDADAADARIAKAERERDEARAEVERLRARLHRCAQCGADDSAVAACEGDEYPLCGPCATHALREARAEAVAAREHTDRAVDEIRRTLPEALRLAADDEREACAAIADDYAAQEDVAGADACARLADAIRARGAGGAT